MLGLRDFFASSSWLRIVVGGLLLLYCVSTTHRVHVPRGGLLRAIPVVLILRALISFWAVVPELYYLTDQVIYSLYMFWIAEYTGRSRPAVGFALYTVAFGGFQILDIVFGISGLAVQIVNEVLLFSSVILIGSQLYHVTASNTEDSRVVIEIRPTLLAILVISRLLLVAGGYEGQQTAYLVLPLTYAAHFYVLWRYHYVQLLEKQELDREVGIAAQIQRQLQPSPLPQFHGAEVAAYSKPVRGVSGDYYDILRLSKDGRLGLVVCDVAGKGIPASLVMVMIRTIVHLIADSGRDAPTIIDRINRGISGQIDVDRFATMSFVIYDPHERSLEYSNAAHHPAIIFHAATGEVERIDTEGLPIGLEQDVLYGKVERKLAAGDVVVLFTDGVVEALNVAKEQYGDDRLLAAVTRYSNKTPGELVAGIRQDIDEFVGRADQHDDQTIVAMKVAD